MPSLIDEEAASFFIQTRTDLDLGVFACADSLRTAGSVGCVDLAIRRNPKSEIRNPKFSTFSTCSLES